MIRALTIALALVSLTATPAVAASHLCGDTVFEGVGAYDVRADAVSCRTAMKVAVQWSNIALTGGRRPRVPHWSCRQVEAPKAEATRVRCRRGASTVRFVWGA